MSTIPKTPKSKKTSFFTTEHILIGLVVLAFIGYYIYSIKTSSVADNAADAANTNPFSPSTLIVAFISIVVVVYMWNSQRMEHEEYVMLGNQESAAQRIAEAQAKANGSS